MIDLGLDDLTMDELIDTLVGTHAYKVFAELHDRSGNVLQNITPYLHADAGQIDVDQDLETGRMLALNLWDPYGEVQLDGASYLHRTVAIDYTQKIDSQDVPIRIPAGRFPIVDTDPQGPLIKISAVGRALLAMGDMLVEHTFPAGHLVISAITTALHDWAGLSLANLQLPNLTDTLPDDYVTAPFIDTPWSVAKYLAGTVGYQIFFDGFGRVQMRQRPVTPCFDFDKRMVTSSPTMSQTLTDSDGKPLPNVVKVNGAPGIHVLRYADPRSPISGQRLAVNDVPWYRAQRVSFPHARTDERANEIGDNVLARAEETAVQYNFDIGALVPLFDEGDCVSVDAFGVAANFQMGQFSMSLAAVENPMSIGKKRQISYAGASARWV